MNIVFKPLKASEIPELNQSNTLYICDFRSLGESFEYEIPAMWKYENLAPWIVKEGFSLVNEDYHLLNYKFNSNLLIGKKDKSPKVSMIERVKNIIDINKLEISKIYTLIPHPQIDMYCDKESLSINYNFSDFLKYNNKITQKKLFKANTPRWKIVTEKDLSIYKNSEMYFLKRSSGSGGYSVIKFNELDLNKIDFQSYEWYVEAFEEGDPMSIQCFKKGDKYIVFGFCEQLIENSKNFVGGKVLNFDETLKDQNLIIKTKEFISNLNKLIGDYNGFFGIDFIYNKANNRINFLESNVRLTAMSIPTLLCNEFNGSIGAVFHEDLTTITSKNNNLKIAVDTYDNTYDLLEFL